MLAASLLIVTGCETPDHTTKKEQAPAFVAVAPTTPVEDKTVRLETEITMIKEKLITEEKDSSTLRLELEKLSIENQKIIEEILIIKKEIYEERKTREEADEKITEQLTAEFKGKEESKAQRYVLPDPPPDLKSDFYIYIVQSGTNLHSISKAYKVSIDDIKKANNLKNDTIYTGQKLHIPKK